MPKKIWRVYVNYGEGNGWVPVSWAPTFSTEAEANEWINGDHDWESPVEAQEEEVEPQTYKVWQKAEVWYVAEVEATDETEAIKVAEESGDWELDLETSVMTEEYEVHNV